MFRIICVLQSDQEIVFIFPLLSVVAMPARAVTIDFEQAKVQGVGIGPTQQCDVLLLLNAPSVACTSTGTWEFPVTDS